MSNLTAGTGVPLKIALCIPAYGMVHGKWVQCLFGMVKHTLEAKLMANETEQYDIEIEMFMVSSSMLCESRHRLTAEASLWGADYMLFMDADHVFPADTLCKLWSRGVDVVGVNYARRCEPTAPTAARLALEEADRGHKDLVYTTLEKADGGVMEEVSHLGFGMVLIRMTVFDQLQAQAEAAGQKSFMPLFVFELKEDGMSMIGEDVYFFRKLRAAGIKVWLDHQASWEFGHLHEMIMTNAHAIVQERDWVGLTGGVAKRLKDRIDEIEHVETLEELASPARNVERAAAVMGSRARLEGAAA